MTALLRKYGLVGAAGLIGALLGAITLGATRCDVALGEAAARASRDTSVNGRLEVLERDAVELREFRVRLRRLEAGQAAMLAWMAAVSPRLGVPPPPAPAALRVPVPRQASPRQARSSEEVRRTPLSQNDPI